MLLSVFFNHMLMEKKKKKKKLCTSWKFHINRDRSVDKTNSKIFQFNFSSFAIIVIGSYFVKRFHMHGSLFYSQNSCYLVFRSEIWYLLVILLVKQGFNYFWKQSSPTPVQPTSSLENEFCLINLAQFYNCWMLWCTYIKPQFRYFINY